MWKVSLISALLCAQIFLGACTLETPSFSRRMTITMPKSTTLVMNNQLYTVSMTKSNVHVNSSDTNHKPCDIAIDPDKNSIKGEMSVDVSNELMYLWGEHSIERVDNRARTKYSLMIINPRDCTLKSADLPDINVGMKPAPARLVILKDGVDFFFPSMKTCAPCRFDNNGKKITVPQVVLPEDGGSTRIFMSDVRKTGPNYLYVQNLEGRKAVMKILDGQNMNVIKEKQVDYPIDSMANTKAAVMGICSKKPDLRIRDVSNFKEINCERINDNLESNAAINIPIQPRSRPISRVSIDIDKDGANSYIAFAEGHDLRVYVHNNEGKLTKSYDMGKIDERFEKYQHRPMQYMPYTHWNVDGFIIGNEYCLVIKQVADNHEVDLHDVRCINI